MLVEGQKIVYAGDTDPFNEVGSPGRVIALSGTAAHVQWSGGPKQGQIELVEQFELVPDRQKMIGTAINSFDQSLEMSATIALQVRATYEESGEDGLITALDETGHLAMLAEHTERAMETLAGALRGDPVFGEVLAQLEPDEAETVLSRVAAVLISDRLKEV